MTGITKFRNFPQNNPSNSIIWNENKRNVYCYVISMSLMIKKPSLPKKVRIFITCTRIFSNEIKKRLKTNRRKQHLAKTIILSLWSQTKLFIVSSVFVFHKRKEADDKPVCSRGRDTTDWTSLVPTKHASGRQNKNNEDHISNVCTNSSQFCTELGASSGIAW